MVQAIKNAKILKTRNLNSKSIISEAESSVAALLAAAQRLNNKTTNEGAEIIISNVANAFKNTKHQ